MLSPGIRDFAVTDYADIGAARAAFVDWLRREGRLSLIDPAQIVLTELATNALLHGGGHAVISFRAVDGRVRVEVEDASITTPLMGWSSDRSMTGRGLALIDAMSIDWGVEAVTGGKRVWAELSDDPDDMAADATASRAWKPSDLVADDGKQRYVVSLGNVPTDLLLAAKSHVDNLVREFTLAAAGARTGATSQVPEDLARLIEEVVGHFAEARLSIKRQALEAARLGASHTRLELHLPADAAEAGEEYLRALDEADTYCRARRLLTLETPPQHRVFRQWYVGQIVRQLRAASDGLPGPPPEPFEQRLLDELERVAAAQRASDRAARLFRVAGALAGAATPSDVASAVLAEGVAALGASGGGMLLSTDDDHLALGGTVGYRGDVVERLASEQKSAELPAAVALRTGEPVWVESREERERRFPELAELEQTTVAMCALPLRIGNRVLGALRFSFEEPRLFDDDERRFVLALAAQTAQALDRAQLQQDRVDVSTRLQRSLLPPQLPEISGLDIAAFYRPLGYGVEVGGDFYDLWPVGPSAWAFAIGDVAGTGPEAAAVTAQARHTLRALTMSDTRPGAVLTKLNRALLEARVSGTEALFCTAIFGVVRIGKRVHVQMATGGHPRPWRIRWDRSVEEVPLEGSLLGVLSDIDVGVYKLSLRPGGALVLMTDGLLEARNADGEFFDDAGVRAALESEAGGNATEIAAGLERRVVQHAGGDVDDDVAILVIRVPNEWQAAGSAETRPAGA